MGNEKTKVGNRCARLSAGESFSSPVSRVNTASASAFVDSGLVTRAKPIT